LEFGEIVAVKIPPPKVERHAPCTSFNQAPGNQEVFKVPRRSIAIVARVSLAIPLANLGVLSRNVQRLRQLAGSQHAERLLGEGVLPIELTAGVQLAADAVHTR